MKLMMCLLGLLGLFAGGGCVIRADRGGAYGGYYYGHGHGYGYRYDPDYRYYRGRWDRDHYYYR